MSILPPLDPAVRLEQLNVGDYRFGGLLTTEFLEPPPGRCFLLRQTYKHDVKGAIPDNLRKLIDSPQRAKGPPLHFHQFQTEYFRVESGMMGIEVDGAKIAVTVEDGEISVKAGSLHQFFIHPNSLGDMTVSFLALQTRDWITSWTVSSSRIGTDTGTMRCCITEDSTYSNSWRYVFDIYGQNIFPC